MASMERLRRGKFKILIGAASGTGKTYHMLREGQQLKASGIDVVVSAVMMLNKSGTAKQMEGLEDILFLLNRGIGVITTVNAYELAGMNEIALRRTGIRAEETIPPDTLDMADEVRLIDVAPETVLKRIEEGVLGGDLPPAIRRRDNLAVLRELSLRLVAEGIKRCFEPPGHFDLLQASRCEGIAGALLKRADDLSATQIILGQPRKLCLKNVPRTVAPELIRRSTGRDVLIVSRIPK